MENYLKNLPKPFLVLAPMFEVTDTVFRQVISEISPPDFSMSEFVNVDGLVSAGRDKLLPKIVYNSLEVPMIYQFWGKNPNNYYQVAKQTFDYSLVDDANTLVGQEKLSANDKIKIKGIDINMGCPDRAILKNGCCSALIKNPSLADEIIEATRDGMGGRGSLSVKTRIGFSEFNIDWIEFLLSKKLNMLSVHLRTVREMSKVPAHFELLEKIVALRDKVSPETLLVANGDIEDRNQSLKLYEDYKIDGAMIGRGIFHNPFAFSDTPEKWEGFSPLNRVELYEKHVKLFKNTWKNNERPIVTLNKFCKIYINGFEGAKELRESLMQAKNADHLLNQLKSIKKRIQN